jgi:hypothetical protein
MPDDQGRGRQPPGLRPIGSLLPPMQLSPESLGSIPTLPATSFATTGWRYRGTRALSSIGLPRSAIAVATPGRRSLDPEAVDKQLLASLPPAIERSLHSRQRIWDEPGSGFHSEIIGYELERGAEITTAEIDRAHELLAVALHPASPQTLVTELTRLRLMTKARAQGDDDQTAVLAIYAEELAEYPADVVVSALRGWAKREVFFPALADLHEACHKASRKRRALAECLGIDPCN